MIKREMQRYYAERETTGPEFDDRLIKLVRANPAIYDVSHPHYRRNPVRVDIWDRIANELGASSRFLQTKWKNIRYNYLQEIKALETGQVNPNVRKRRFTEDLSFLQNTAQTYNVRKAQSYFVQTDRDRQSTNTNNGGSSDNDSNSFLYPDPEHLRIDLTENYDIIELDDNSEDGGSGHVDGHSDNEVVPELMVMEPKPDVTLQQQQPLLTAVNGNGSNSNSHNNTQVNSPASSPLLMPMVVMGNGDEVTHQDEHNNKAEQQQHQQQQQQQQQQYGNSALSNGEVTIEPIYKAALTARRCAPVKDIMANAAKRKAMAAPLPRLAPINDPIELYCLSLVDTLRSMPRSERERVKFEFANILKDAKYKDEA
ncbi:putative mediator of RNA polymerase II transcription subunit 26 [Drosophila grimshawi]|uniref:GH21050 n=7 Tax=picture wing clade TaxID=48384 RepID=B4J5H7_DROGR|nr:putative mediator of RNA polymerase II transcription subunit 26 [Drosophila grimshawi]EDW00740.1 GH21050 [Drosophila grimshawi]